MTGRGRRSPTSRILPALSLALAVSALAATPLAADWLVMTNGAQVETRGTWTERGKLVVFTDALGQLVSVRRSEVDIDESHRATREAVEAANRPPPPPPPPRESVFRLTDADVGHVDDEGGNNDAADADDEGGDGEAAPPPQVLVIAWDRQDNPTGDGSTVRATLENQGSEVAINITVSVTLYDDDGTALVTTVGTVAATGLVPGQTTEMVADFPDVFDFAAVTFDISQRLIATRSMDETPSIEDSFGIDGGF